LTSRSCDQYVANIFYPSFSVMVTILAVASQDTVAPKAARHGDLRPGTALMACRRGANVSDALLGAALQRLQDMFAGVSWTRPAVFAC